MKRIFAFAVIAAALLAVGCREAHAETRTCDVTTAADGSFTVACKPQAAAPPVVTPPAPPAPPAPPVQPPDPPAPPAPPPPSSSACPPNLSPFICALLGAGNTATGPSAPATGPSNPESFDDPTFTFRCGSVRRLYGESGAKSLVALNAATLDFDVTEAGLNETQLWHITATVNGAVVYDADTSNVFNKTPPISVKAGDAVTIAVRSREPGKRASVSIRLSVDGC